MDRMGVQPVLPIKVLVTIDTLMVTLIAIVPVTLFVSQFDNFAANNFHEKSNFLQTNPSKFVKCTL